MKKIHPLSVMKVLTVILLLCCFSFWAFGIVVSSIENNLFTEMLSLAGNKFVAIIICVLLYVAMIAGLIINFIAFIKEFQKKIVFYDDHVYVSGDFGFGEVIRKIQYETEVPYKSIKKISLIISSKDSHNRSRSLLFTPMPYIKFECEGLNHLVCVYYHSKKQVIDIIDTTKAHMEMVNNQATIPSGQEIYDEFLLSQKRKK